MNVPVGTPKIQGRRLSAVNVTKDLAEFMSLDKMGYIAITIKGAHGLQEGLLIVENGRLIGAYYEYLSLGRSYNAKEALERSLNAFFAEKGIYDSYELTVQQIELLKIFNEDMLFLEPVDNTALQGMIPMQHNEEYEKKLLEPGEKTKEQIMKERGIREIEINNYQRIREQMTDQIARPTSTTKVEKGVNAYLTGKPILEEPKHAPIVQEESTPKKVVIKSSSQTKKRDELGNLDAKAEQLLKQLQKAKTNDKSNSNNIG
ncbi:DUF2226 domain-containing protein [archaeon]|nr:DUF2226 domain-containing protein [archaeon]